jgi:predicted LPLAT superfamily acyltransferase
MSAIARYRVGIGVIEACTWCITTVYFLYSDRQRAISVHFYEALFPSKNHLFHLWCVWRQFHHFSTVFSDHLVAGSREIFCESHGIDHIQEAFLPGQRGILLMSHVGNWQIAARKLADYGIKVALFLGSKQAQAIEARMKSVLGSTGITIVSVQEHEDAPLNVLEALHFLKNEGFIAMPGDRIWSRDQKCLTMDFLGHIVRLPQAPFALALALKVPLFAFFIIRTGRVRYRIIYNQPIVIPATSRTEREGSMREAARTYLALLEEVLRIYPEHRYCFEPFLAPYNEAVHEDAC